MEKKVKNIKIIFNKTFSSYSMHCEQNARVNLDLESRLLN